MSAIPTLKKKLKSVRATGKLSKAMKTVSAVKFSQLSATWKNYSAYSAEFRFIYSESCKDGCDTVVVLGSNRGFCGALNNDVFSFYRESVHSAAHVIVCGEEIASIFRNERIEFEREFVFGDVPSFAETEPLLEYLITLSEGRRDFPVRFIYPEYINTLMQLPRSEWIWLNRCENTATSDDCIVLPDTERITALINEKCLRSIVYGTVLKTAISAQAATLMTMRSAYDSAEEYCESIEGEIRRLRQSEVTADVIETSSERGAKGGENNG